MCDVHLPRLLQMTNVLSLKAPLSTTVSFFNIGGNSLLVMRLLSAVRNQFSDADVKMQVSTHVHTPNTYSFKQTELAAGRKGEDCDDRCAST